MKTSFRWTDSFGARRVQLRLRSLAWVALLWPIAQGWADDLAVATMPLPPLRIAGQDAKAHAQGLEIHADQYYVTARREGVVPKRALLLRTDAQRTNWDVWDITPVDGRGELTGLDHPGGMQSDGKRLWIPLAESRPKSRSLVRAYALGGMVHGQPLKAEFEFSVEDHIGAVAVVAKEERLLGANWDTQRVYVWDFEGRLRRTIDGSERARRGLGAGAGAGAGASRDVGLAVQDWKMVEDRLVASGLFRGSESGPGAPQSRLMLFSRFVEPAFQRWSVLLPKHNGAELAHEGMAIANGVVHFLPDDLGETNRIYQVRFADVVRRKTP